MPPWTDGFPPATHVRDYLAAYERRYDVPVQHGVRVTAVEHHGDGFHAHTTAGVVRAHAVVSATGTWGRPFWPTYPGQRDYTGRQLHTADYTGPDSFTGQHVLVVGGGNSAAQLLAEISTVAHTMWVTPRPPRLLPDDVDGRVLFDVATARAVALARGEADTGGVGGLGDIVAVPPVRQARDRGVLVAQPLFERFTTDGVVWADGHHQSADAVVWCTGFRPDLGHLAPLHLPREHGHPVTTGTVAHGITGLRLLGYGDWTGPASATLLGVGRTARDATAHIAG
jgi:putative flavoprotein involved in K+ transport